MARRNGKTDPAEGDKGSAPPPASLQVTVYDRNAVPR